MKYLIVVEKTETGYSAFCPDLDGCAAAGETRDEVERLMKEAIEFHIEGLKIEGHEVPLPKTYSKNIEVAA